MKTCLVCLFILFICLSRNLFAQAVVSHPPVRMILDTDIGPDYDDVGAMALFHAFADRGEVIPLAVFASNRNAYVAPVIDLLNTFYGRPDLPVGSPVKNAPSLGASQHWPEMLLKRYPHRLQSTEDAQQASSLYRKLLASQANRSVTIVTIGFLSNLAALLKSKPDQYSPLNGRDLVKLKVKELVSMAGWFPQGREFNLYMDSVSSASVFQNWPGKVIFSGFEVGKQIKTGPGLLKNKNFHGPVKEVFAYCMPKSAEDAAGRMSWDETAVWVAVRGARPFFKLIPGHIVIKGGSNSWHSNKEDRQAYLALQCKPSVMAAELEQLMVHLPRER